MPVSSQLNPKVLLVDDEEFLVNILADSLGEQGYQVVKSYDGREALKLFLQDPLSFAVVVIDANLPGMMGDAFVQEIRNRDFHNPVLLITGDVSQRLKVTNLANIKILLKPFDAKDLYRSLTEAAGQ